MGVSAGVWPTVETHGQLESAEAEWLHTNGAGAYAMSTVAFMHTRRFHGLLVAALEPPLARHVIVSHADTTVEVGTRQYRLATHQFPEIAPTPGYRLLESFAQDPLPRWRYRLGKGILERRICLARGQNALVMEYTWFGRGPVTLRMKPLMPMRTIHQLRREHGGLLQRVSLRRGAVFVQPVHELPPVVFGHPHLFMGSPDWWRRFEYSEDRERQAAYQEDLWTPGTFELRLEPEKAEHVVVAVGELPPVPPVDLMEEAKQELLALDPGTDHSVSVRALCVAAEQFRVSRAPRACTLAGYPWLGEYSRDTLISLPGLYLSQGLIDEAKAVLRALLDHRRDELLLAGFSEEGGEATVSVDASLWCFEAVRQLRRHLAPDDPFLQEECLPFLEGVFRRVLAAEKNLVWLSEDGLLVARSPQLPLTWMDSKAAGQAVTPRWGLAVEHQALFTSGCLTLAEMAADAGAKELQLEAMRVRERATERFRQRFWCDTVRYPYDCIDEQRHDHGDAAIRPNAVLALDLDPSLFEPWQAEAIIDQARNLLLTPRGLRTLAPNHPKYVGYYEGTMDSRRAAYHQGVAWAYLLGAYARAVLRLFPEDFERQVELRELATRAMENGPVLGQVAQVASGDLPHNAGGSPAQAWSVAELLRTLRDDLRL